MSEKDVDGIYIVLAGEERVLVPTFGAARAVSNHYGGVNPAMERVIKLDLEVVTDIIALGLGYVPPKRPPEDFSKKVYETGMTDDTGGLAHRCIAFLHMLAGGGRPPKTDDDREGDETEDPR